LLVALACLFGRKVKFQAGVVSWLATTLLAYRLGLIWTRHKVCSCLGNITGLLHIPPQTADTAMEIVLAYLLIGSYATLFWLWRRDGKVEGRTQNVEVKSAGSSEVGAGG
jgi:hypothetical protein